MSDLFIKVVALFVKPKMGHSVYVISLVFNSFVREGLQRRVILVKQLRATILIERLVYLLILVIVVL